MVRLLDLKVCDAKVEYNGIWSGRCGYAWLDLSFIIKLKLYVKYEIARWTYHDKLVIGYCIDPSAGAPCGRAVDKVVSNPTNQDVVKEEIIDTTIQAVVSYTRSIDDMRKSGYKSFTVSVHEDPTGAYEKTLNISFYWNASNCTVSNITVKGTEP